MSEDYATAVKISHWLPIITRCPLAWFPDFIYVYLYVEGPASETFVELYEARRELRTAVQYRKAYMETIARDLLDEFPQVAAVEVRLLFGRHSVTMRRQK